MIICNFTYMFKMYNMECLHYTAAMHIYCAFLYKNHSVAFPNPEISVATLEECCKKLTIIFHIILEELVTDTYVTIGIQSQPLLGSLFFQHLANFLHVVLRC